MEMHFGPRYPHRENKDGSYDSICTACFATIASVRNETELARHERAHVCDQDWCWIREPKRRPPIPFPSANGFRRSRFSTGT